LFFAYSILIVAQPGCPQVNAGPDQTLPCGTSCTNISASYFNTGATTTYTVAPIAYTPFSYTAGTSVIVGADDVWTSAINLPFNFCFFGNTYNQVVIGANEIISFDVTYAGQTCPWNLEPFPPIPTSTLPTNSIMGPYQDIDPSCGGSIKYQILGAYPCRIFVVSYNNIPMYNGACLGFDPQCVGLSGTSQIVLYETTNAIEIYIARKESCPDPTNGWNGGLAIEGIQDATGATAYAVPGRNNTVWNVTNDAYRFTPDGPSIVTVNWTGPGVNSTVTGDPTQVYSIPVCPPGSSTVPVTSTYTATATYNRCDGTTVVKTDDVNITTTPGPNGGPDQNLGCYMAGLTATMAGTAFAGATWTALNTNPGGTTIGNISNPATTITGFPGPGTYKYVWGPAGTCKDTVLVVIPATASAGPNQTVNCATLPGGTTTMGAAGTGTWTYTGPGTATITPITSPTATVSNFSAAGVYTLTWTNGSCVASATVTVTSQPNAGPDKTVNCATIPGGSVAMSAVGTGTWTYTGPGTATITPFTSPTATVSNFSAAGVYTLTWTRGTCTDQATVTVTAQPNAGPDKTVTCVTLPGGSTTMAATTPTGTWSYTGPGTATIAPATSPTATVSNFSAAGVYTLTWTDGTCTDQATVTVSTLPDAGPDKTVTCAALPGGSVAMSAVGTGTWTYTGPGTATITPVTSPTATVSNFSAAGVYTLTWTNGACTDQATVTVTAAANAGPDKTVSCVTLPGGTVNMAATGAGTWTYTGPGTATIAPTTGPTATVSNFSAAGVYTLTWTVGTCTDVVTVTVTALPSAGPDKTVNCVATFPGGSATMAAVGTGTWTPVPSGNPGTATITPANSPTATISNFTAPGVYTFRWTNAAGCIDSATVTVTARPNAGANQTVNCVTVTGGTATMAATGTGTWTMSGGPGSATIVSPTLPNTTILNFTATGLYTFTWTNAAGCTSSATVSVNSPPDAGPDKIVTCASLPGGSVVMGAVGAGTWSAQPTGNPGTAIISAPATNPTATISNFSAPGVYTFIRTNGVCKDTATVTVTAKPNAGPDKTVLCAILPGGSATMAAVGAGTWTDSVGNPGTAIINSPTDPLTTISTFSVPGVYKFFWTNAAGCADAVTVTVTAKPDAGADQVVSCAILPGGTATMAATGTGLWSVMSGNPGTATFGSTSNPNTTIYNYTAPGVYHFIWTNGTCKDTVTVTVTSQPNAGPNRIITCAPIPGGGSTTMAAVGAGTWSDQGGNPGTSTITNANTASATISNFSAAGVYIYTWTNAAGCIDTATVTVTALSNAGPDQTVICAQLPGGIATMAAVTPTGVWTARGNNPGTSNITDINDPATTITNFSVQGVYYFVWSNGTCRDTVSVTVTGQTNAGPSRNLPCVVLAGATAAMSGAGTGTWVPAASGNPGTATIHTPNTPSTVIDNFSAPGVYTFIYGNATCAASTTVTITERPDAGPDQTVDCVVLPGGTATMAATGTGAWTAYANNPGAVTINNSSLPTTSITDFPLGGVYKFVWTNGVCSDTAAVTVTPLPTAGPGQSISCVVLPGGSVTMAGTGGGIWSAGASGVVNPGNANINNPSQLNTIISGFTASGQYTFTLTNGTCTSSTTVDVTASPGAGPDQFVCEFNNATMAATGSGTWSEQGGNPGTDVITSPTDPNTTITDFSVPGVYTFIWTNADGCTDQATITVTAKPSGGSDQNVCQNASATMAGVGTGVWSNAGANPTTATITNPTQSNTTITGLTSIGIYSFVWTVNGCTDTVDIFVNPQPSVSIADDSACLGNSITLTAVPDLPGGLFQWSGGLGNSSSITVSPSATTPYTVTYTLGICSATATGNAIIHTLPVVNVGTANSICTANNGKAWADVTGTSPYTYAWSSPPGGSTDTITGLAPNSYSVTVTDLLGCTGSATGTVGLDAPTIPITLVSEHDLKCNSDNTGSITINAVDSGTLIYAWTPSNNNSNSITGLAAQNYSVSVTDQFGCTGTAQYTVNEPTPLVLPALTWTDPVCPGSSDGTATGSPSGGSGTYHYDWSTIPAQNTQQATGLPAGPYTLSVTDDSSCVASASVTLTDPAATTFGPGSVTDALCHGSSTGTVTVNPQGAFGPYSYLWSDISHQISQQATGLAAGPYSVVVTDSRGCTVSTAVTIGEPSAVIVLASHTDLTCYQNNSGTASASASGGTVPYTYDWSNGDSTAQIFNLPAATYFVTVTDGLGCTATANTTTLQPTTVMLTATSTSTTCAATVDGTVTVIGSGGAGAPYTYSLKDVVGNTIQSNSTGLFTGLGAQLYTVVATDQNGCSASDVITVPRAEFNVYTATADSTSCYGEQYHDGSIHLAGGAIPNAPFQYSVDNGPLQYIPDFYDLSAGAHLVHIVDAHNCDTSFTIIVGEPLPASVDILPGDSTIVLGSSLQLSTAFRPYSTDSIKSYAWSPADGLSCSDCPAPVASPYSVQNSYTLTVTYNQGCQAITTVRINVQGDPPVFIPSAFSPNGDGNNDVLYVYGEGIKTVSMTIFNRWGEKVFESDNQSQGWDGTYKGTLQEPGVYIYLVDLIYLNDHKKLKEGSVTLIR
jgi:gliding motility-associated-like protein